MHLDPEFFGIQRLVAARHFCVGTPFGATSALWPHAGALVRCCVAQVIQYKQCKGNQLRPSQ